MTKIWVHNISDRPNTPGKPQAYQVAGQRLGPGKSLLVEKATINRKLRSLHGTRLWFGQLHGKFVRTSKSAQRAAAAALAAKGGGPMGVHETKKYLSGLRLSDLRDLCQQMSPPLKFRQRVSLPALVARLSRALFQRDRELDPEHFFWLRRWRKQGEDFVLLEE